MAGPSKIRASRRYAAFPKRIFGLYCSQHRAFNMQHIIQYYQKRVGARATKERLLNVLMSLEKQVSKAEAEGIQEWLESKDPTPASLRFILDDVKDGKVKVKAEVKVEIKREPSLELRSPSPPPPRTKECCVCAEDLPESSFPEQKITSTCNHEATTCRDCVSATIATQIPELAWDQLHCPECPETLPYDVVKTWASAESFELYDKKSLLAAFQTMPNFTMCLAPGCGSGQIHEGGDAEPIMTCRTCNYKTCFSHKMPWHEGQTCAEYDTMRRERMEQEAASETFIYQNAKICPNPNCGHGIIKHGGCDHMTCRQCNYQFCYAWDDWGAKDGSVR
ncbi:related to RING finger protein Dorfin [Phialocephala subalpina]|uniref:RBR-type E3 ubiquitin transferase n=1 Tax=Phialocephala subalpina TaxID=576137 RepID=A0A1L7WGD6_9HELO|nr:related to RING finger protein Dorfin [Phialocephala subalpina]